MVNFTDKSGVSRANVTFFELCFHSKSGGNSSRRKKQCSTIFGATLSVITIGVFSGSSTVVFLGASYDFVGVTSGVSSGAVYDFIDVIFGDGDRFNVILGVNSNLIPRSWWGPWRRTRRRPWRSRRRTWQQQCWKYRRWS